MIGFILNTYRALFEANFQVSDLQVTILQGSILLNLTILGICRRLFFFNAFL
ncbi:hypothetical protein CAL7102_07998 [Dulcicalothrix desertica PCC 7102]|nr:hypothetical protein CAL7102_07998 [Dulcicalothrix desertica PCC 7102]